MPQIKIKKDLTCKFMEIQNEYGISWKMFSQFSELFRMNNACFCPNMADLQIFSIHVIV